MNDGQGGDVVYIRALVRPGGTGPAVQGALWARNDRIQAIGPTDELLRAAGPTARVVDLAGATILPGLIDPHCHPAALAYLLTCVDCSQPTTPDIPAIQHALAAAEPGPEGWVSGFGFAEYKLAERRLPTRWDLDVAVPDRPCVLYQVSLHVGVVNSAGLAALGLDERTPDPPGGRLGRDPEDRLDGVLYEQPIFDVTERNQARHAALTTEAERIAEQERAALHLAGLGLTSVTDAACDRAGVAGLRLAGAAGRLPIRVTAMPWHDGGADFLDDLPVTGSIVDGIRIGAVKLIADGGMSSRTAAVDEPYETPAGEMGVLVLDPATLADRVRGCADAGYQVGIHAQGDRGIRAAIDALEPVCRGGNPMRHRIEHGGLFPAALRRRAGAAGIVVVSQPPFLSVLGDGFLEAFGPERSADLYPFASLRDEGITVAGSSDAPVVTADPRVGIRDAVLRRTAGGSMVAAHEAVTAAEALAMYTSRAAHADHLDGELGTLEVGRLADLTIVDRDPLTIDPEAIADLRILRTVVGGRTVFEATAD